MLANITFNPHPDYYEIPKIAYAVGNFILTPARYMLGESNLRVTLIQKNPAIDNPENVPSKDLPFVSDIEYLGESGSNSTYLKTMAAVILFVPSIVLGLPIKAFALIFSKELKLLNVKNISTFFDVKKNNIKNLINSTQDPFSNLNKENKKTLINLAKKQPFHKIMKNLFLGNGQSFIQGCGLRIIKTENCRPSGEYPTANAAEFKTVITVCPVAALSGDYIDLIEYTEEDINNGLKTNGISWFLVGKDLADSDEAWFSLVCDCTFMSETAKRTTLIGEATVEKFKKATADKNEKILQQPVNKWFKDIFNEIDKAVFGDQKVLVHCQAGQSRSATLLAAYLIKRFQVTADEAVIFLQSKRCCVESKFMEGLKDYQKKLGIK